MSNAIVVIMAGGLGKRMNSTLPKVLHKINNIPMLVHVVKEAEKLNPIKILIVVGKFKSMINETLSKYNINLANIVYVNQNIPKGTGHAVQCCVVDLFVYNNSIKNAKVIILSGDVPLLKHDTLNGLIKTTKNVGILTTELRNPNGYGRIIETDEKIVGIIEEKDCDSAQKLITHINGGIYCFNCETLCKRIFDLSNNNAQKEYYLTDMIKILRENENADIDIYKLPEDQQFQIMGVNTSEQLEQLEKIIQHDKQE